MAFYFSCHRYHLSAEGSIEPKTNSTHQTGCGNTHSPVNQVIMDHFKIVFHHITCFFRIKQTDSHLAWHHGTSTPPTVCRSPTHGLRRFERSDCGCEGVSLSCLLSLSCPAPADVDRSLKRGRGASTGTVHTECIRLLYVALDLRAFFFKVQ